MQEAGDSGTAEDPDLEDPLFSPEVKTLLAQSGGVCHNAHGSAMRRYVEPLRAKNLRLR